MKKIALILITAFTLNLVLFAMPMVGHAGEGIESSNKTFSVTENLKLGGATTHNDQAASYFNDNSPIVSFISKIIEYLSYIIGSIAVILVMASGFRMMVSQGNQQKVDEAKDMFQYAIIGLIVVFLSYIITIFVQSIFISAK